MTDLVIGRLGPFHLEWQGVCRALALLSGLLAAIGLARAAGLTAAAYRDAILWTLPEAALAARLGHILTHLEPYLLAPDRWWQVWDGGWSLGAGVVVGAVAAWRFARARRLSFATLADAAGLGLTVAQPWLALATLGAPVPPPSVWLAMALAGLQAAVVLGFALAVPPRARPSGSLMLAWLVLQGPRELALARLAPGSGASLASATGWTIVALTAAALFVRRARCGLQGS